MYFVCDTIGTGADAEGNQIRPAVALHTGVWTVTADAPGMGRMLVRCEHLPAFDADARIRPLRRSLLANLAPDDGEADDWDAPDLATKVARRFLLRQWLAADDFEVSAGALNATLADIPAARRGRIRNRLQERGIDISGLAASTSVADALRAILPQFDVRLDPGKQAPSGTFTDNFSGEVGTVDLSAHTPSGGTSWVRVDGSANAAQVLSAGYLTANINDSTGAMYRCDDQGSADQYLQFTTKTSSTAAFCCNRATDSNNYIGVRPFTNLQIFKRVSGTFTQLGSTGAGSVSVGNTVRLESSGNAHQAFLNGVSQIGPTNDSSHASVTRQGVNSRAIGDWLDDFEAGALGGGVTAKPWLYYRMMGA